MELEPVVLFGPFGVGGVDVLPGLGHEEGHVEALLGLADAPLALFGVGFEAEVVHLPQFGRAGVVRSGDDVLGEGGGGAGQAEDEDGALDDLVADLRVLGLKAADGEQVGDAGLDHVLRGAPADAGEGGGGGPAVEEEPQALQDLGVLVGEDEVGGAGVLAGLGGHLVEEGVHFGVAA
nr:hypothetical protein GCM10025732_39300 [Glycomyces mayteni]